MSSGNSHNSYSQQEQIRRYVSGEMSAAEMHALEKEALLDPFLADAIEGVALREPVQFNADIRELKTSLSEKTGAKVFRLPQSVSWRKYAIAAIILGIAILSTVLLVNRQPEEVQIAQSKINERSVPDSVTQLIAPIHDSVTIDTTKQNQFSLSSQEKVKTTKPVLKQEAKDLAASSNLAKEEESVSRADAKNSQAASPDQPNTVTGYAEKKADDDGRLKPMVSKADPLHGFLKSVPPASTNSKLFYFTGRVTDSNQHPISFANIAIKNSNNLTYTDANGYFRLLAADSLLNIDVKSVGFVTNSVMLSYKQPEQTLVLTNLPVRLKKSKFQNKRPTSENISESDSIPPADSLYISTDPVAEPVDGWGPYHIYLLNNVRTQKGVEGNVVVSFVVNNMGWLSEFKIEKSLSPASDREALRLIKEGPKWDLYNTEKPQRVKLTISFN